MAAPTKAGGDVGAIHPNGRTSAEIVGAQGVFAGRLAVMGIAEREQARAEPLELGEGFVEAIFGDERGFADVALAAHVPFAEMAGGVAGVLEHAGEGRGPGVEPMGHAAGVVGGAVVQEGVDAPALRILTGGEAVREGEQMGELT